MVIFEALVLHKLALARSWFGVIRKYSLDAGLIIKISGRSVMDPRAKKKLRACLVGTEGGPTVPLRNCLICGNGCCQIHTVSLRSTVRCYEQGSEWSDRSSPEEKTDWSVKKGVED